MLCSKCSLTSPSEKYGSNENKENHCDFANSPRHLIDHASRSANSSRYHFAEKEAVEQKPLAKKFRKEQSQLWDQRYEELRAFKQEHGHCNVPRTWLRNPQLGTWLNTQRKQYRLSIQGEPSQMNPERRAKLEQLGFKWSLCEKQDWDVRFQELSEYKLKHGDCLVPQRYQLNPQLGIWVNNQRTQYRAFKEGRVGPMTADRAKRLDEIGFIWNVSKRRIGTRNMQCSSTYPKQKSYKTVRKALSFPVVSPTDDDSFFSPDSSADIAAAARVLQRMQKLAVKRRYRLI